MAPPLKDKEQQILRERLIRATDPELVPLMTTSVPRYLRLFSYFATGFAGTFLALEGYQRWTRRHQGAQPGGQKNE